jgi:hypothetical protein
MAARISRKGGTVVRALATSVPSECIAIPVRLSAGGRLELDDPWHALDNLIQVMLLTSERTWVHAPWFGLHEIATDPRQDEQELHEALVLAFERLEIGWAAVRGVRMNDTDAISERSFDIDLVATDGTSGEYQTKALVR